MNKFNSKRLLKSFELNKSMLSTVVGGSGISGGGSAGGGGTYEEATNWFEGGNPACSSTCPDSVVDIRDSSGNLIGTR